MTNDDFFDRLKSDMRALSSRYRLSEGKAFAMWYATQHLDLDEAEAFEAVSFDGPNDKDIDLLHFDSPNERVVIGQFKYQGNGTYRAKKGELLGLVHTIDWLNDPAALKREGRDDLAEAANDFKAAVAAGHAVQFIYAFCGAQRKDVSDSERMLNARASGDSAAMHCSAVSLERLIDLTEERIGIAPP